MPGTLTSIGFQEEFLFIPSGEVTLLNTVLLTVLDCSNFTQRFIFQPKEVPGSFLVAERTFSAHFHLYIGRFAEKLYPDNGMLDEEFYENYLA